MRCRTCDYELWNLAPGPCPECGTLWAFEQYRFRIGAAQFLCAHCEHPYAGTDVAGLPTPRHFVCTECQNEISLAQMRALPAPGTNRDEAMADRHPWIERARIGRWRAFWQTTRHALTSPTRLATALPSTNSLAAASRYSVLCTTLAVTGCVLVPFTAIGLVEVITSNRGAMALMSLLIPLVAFVGVAVLLQVLIYGWAASAHLLLRMTGETPRDWKTTASAIHFCAAPVLLCAIPCCGFYVVVVAFPWMVVCAVVALVGVQKVSAGRAAFAAVTPAALLLLVIGGSLAWLVTTALALSSAALVPAPPISPAQGTAAVDESIAPQDESLAPDETEGSDAQALPAP